MIPLEWHHPHLQQHVGLQRKQQQHTMTLHHHSRYYTMVNWIQKDLLDKEDEFKQTYIQPIVEGTQSKLG
jgi:hypothetical protein